MKKDIALLEEYKTILYNRIEELQKELKNYDDNIVSYIDLSNTILELQSQHLKVQGLIIENI
jgi:CRISPR/Cas system-associated endonuclease Cas3-HD